MLSLSGSLCQTKTQETAQNHTHKKKQTMSLHSFLSSLCLTHNVIASHVKIVMDNAVPAPTGALRQNAVALVENKGVVVATAAADDADDDFNVAPRCQHNDDSSSLIMMEYGCQMMIDTLSSSSMAALPGMRQVSSDSSILLLTTRKSRISTIQQNLTRDTRRQTIGTSSSSTHNASWAEMPTKKKEQRQQQQQQQQKIHTRTIVMTAGSIGSPPRPPDKIFRSGPLDTPSTRPLKQSSLMLTETTNNPPATPKQMEGLSSVEKISPEPTRSHDFVPTLTVDITYSDQSTKCHRERNRIAKAMVVVTPTTATITNPTPSKLTSSIIQEGGVIIGSDRSTTKHLPISFSNLPFQTPDSPPPCMRTSSTNSTTAVIPKK
jgi:hypothetical protein